jgi:hypothetical protein
MIRKMMVLSATMMLIICASASADQCVGVKITGLDAQVTSIQIPTVPGSPETGPITVSLDPNGSSRVGVHSCDYNTGYLYWPVMIDFPLLGSVGRPPVATTLVGPYFCLYDTVIAAVDFGYLDDPDFGQLVFSNYNNNKKGFPPVFWCEPSPPLIEGAFTEECTTFFDSEIKPWLRGAMDEAMWRLRSIDPGVPYFSPGVLDTIFDMYCNDPSTEIIVYFPQTGTFEGAHLTGTDQLTIVSDIPTLTEWGLIIFGVLLLGFITWVFLKRRKVVSVRV